jgi:hypothetical protein
MLSFISFWRAAAIVLNDLGSSAFYAGGIAEQAVGKAAPWFILAVMFFSYGVRAVYIESSSMFTRGGVYRVVKEAMGGTLAKLSVSALMFDYILTVAIIPEEARPKYMDNLISGLSMNLISSRGDVYRLGEAYAFGVIWSFTFNAFGALVLRFKRPGGQEWKVPGNVRIGGVEIPLGMGVIALILLSVALVNLVTKQVATISGLIFTAIFFGVFTLSERISRRKADRSAAAFDPFNLAFEQELSSEVVHARPGAALVAVSDPNALWRLERVLERTDTEEQDVVVMTVKALTGPHSGERDLYEESLFTKYERQLFTRVVAVAERQGKSVELIVVPSKNVYYAMALTAQRIDSAMIVAGGSRKMNAKEQARRLRHFWERLPERPRRQVEFRVIESDGSERVFYLA